jgi:multicomponent Na+:H+ antiporter subunit G
MIRVVIAAVLFAFAAATLLLSVIGVYKFRFVMNRMHAAALGDTLGIGCVLIAVAILTGELVPILKLALVLVFMFLTGPVVTHLIAGAEVETHKNAGHEYKEVDRR